MRAWSYTIFIIYHYEECVYLGKQHRPWWDAAFESMMLVYIFFITCIRPVPQLHTLNFRIVTSLSTLTPKLSRMYLPIISPYNPGKILKSIESLSLIYMCRARGGRVYGRPLKNNKTIGFLINTGPDPIKNHKAMRPAFNVGPRSARK